MKIVISAGGTGGHIYPGIALAEAIKETHPDWNILFVGAKEGLEKELVPEAGFEIKLIQKRGPLRFIKAFFMLAFERPAVVVAFGGYSCLPLGLSAAILRIPLILHEQNLLPGKTNRFLSRFSKAVALSFEPSLQYMRGIVTGNPVRKKIASAARKAHAGRTVLILGGSQGAASINRSIISSLKFFKGKDVKIIHSIGKRDFDELSREFDLDLYPFYKPSPYMYNIEEAYAEADLVVSRAGATAIAEIVTMGLPSILAPFPYAAEGHQDLNASYIKKAGAAEVLSDAELASLPELVVKLLSDGARLSQMSKAAQHLTHKEAAARLMAIVGSRINK